MRIYRRNGGRVWYLDRYPYVKKGPGRIISLRTTSKKVATVKKEDEEWEFYEQERLGKGKLKEIPFEKLCPEYLLYCRDQNSEGTYRRKRGIIKNHLIPVFGGRKVSEITVHEIEIYKRNRRQKVSPACVNRELACLKHMFSLAVLWGNLRVNPAIYVKDYKEPAGRKRYLLEDEEERLLPECSHYLRYIVITDLETGMRKSELLNLQWCDIDLVNGIILLEETKDNAGRVIPITDRLYETLVSMGPKVGEQYVFAHKEGQHKGMRFRDIKDGFKAALKRAGITNFRFHDLRHTYGTRLLMKGVNSLVIQVLMGHKTQRMTARYTHVPFETLRQAVDKLQEPEYNGSGIWHTFGTQGRNKKCVPAKR